MQPEHLGGVHAERAVDEDRKIRQPPGVNELVQRVDEQLRPADGKRRNDHLAAVVQRLGKEPLDFVRQAGLRRVIAIAVGTLDQQQIDVLHRLRVAQDRVVATADVAAKQQPPLVAGLVDVEDHLCRAEDVAGIAEGQRHAVGHRDRSIVAQRDKLPHRALRVLRGIKRLDWWQPLFLVLL